MGCDVLLPSKTDWVQLLKGVTPDKVTAYLEIRAGSGAALLQAYTQGLLERCRERLIATDDHHLVELYESVRDDDLDDDAGIWKRLEQIAAHYNKSAKSTYETIAGYWTNRNFSGSKRAFLAHTVKNHTWSVNVAGAFNGQWLPNAVFDRSTIVNMRKVTPALRQCNVITAGAIETLETCDHMMRPGTLVIVDAGHKLVADSVNQTRLAQLILGWRNSGAIVAKA